MGKKRDPVICGDCGADMNLRPSRYGRFWGCSNYPECKGTHGAHPNGDPLGIPADRETKNARIKAHAAFDKLHWDSASRREAYRWMQSAMGMTKKQAHIAKMNRNQCELLIATIEVRNELRGELVCKHDYISPKLGVDDLTGQLVPRGWFCARCDDAVEAPTP